MDKIIVELLKKLIMEYNRVSLPCLGSFLSEYTPSSISNGKVYPPSKSIVFLQNEIWNDEKLEKSLALHINESIGTAKEKIAFWIDHICVLLATGEDVILPDLGKLYISNQSKLVFEQQSENLLLESFGLEPIELPATSSGRKNTNPKNNDNDDDDDEEENKTIGKSLTIGITIILLMALIAACAIFRYILTDNQNLPGI